MYLLYRALYTVNQTVQELISENTGALTASWSLGFILRLVCHYLATLVSCLYYFAWQSEKGACFSKFSRAFTLLMAICSSSITMATSSSCWYLIVFPLPSCFALKKDTIWFLNLFGKDLQCWWNLLHNSISKKLLPIYSESYYSANLLLMFRLWRLIPFGSWLSF